MCTLGAIPSPKKRSIKVVKVQEGHDRTGMRKCMIVAVVLDSLTDDSNTIEPNPTEEPTIPTVGTIRSVPFNGVKATRAQDPPWGTI